MGISRLREQFNLTKSMNSLRLKEKIITKTQNTNISPRKSEPNREENEMHDIVSAIIGSENMDSFETYHKETKSIKSHIATVYYKEWAQGVAHDSTLLGATTNAIKLLRIELINKRDKLNRTIDRMPRIGR